VKVSAVDPGHVVVMGVSGVGKSTLAQALAKRLGVPYVDADTLHPAANVAKMAAGVALDDADRWPWLTRVRMAMRAEGQVVVACSALRRSYRDALRGAGGVRFLHLAASPALIEERLTLRHGHFMHADMLAGQLKTLEPPGPDETDVATLPAADDPSALLDDALRALERLRPGTSVAPLVAARNATPTCRL